MIEISNELVINNNIISTAFVVDNIVVGGTSLPASFIVNVDGDELYNDSVAGGGSEVINLNVVVV